MATFYKTIITYEILSEEPIPDSVSLADIDRECEDGAWVGQFGETKQQELTGKEMADELYAFGSDPTFFMLDDNGNPMGEAESELFCIECGEPMFIEPEPSGVSHHDEPDDINYDADNDHVAVSDIR
jgi:hypothetical protein